MFKMLRLSPLLFSDNLAVVLNFWTLQDKHNICTLSVDIILICNHQSLAFIPVSKARTDTLYIFRQSTYILYLLIVYNDPMFYLLLFKCELVITDYRYHYR